MSQVPAYLLRWKGQQVGPFTKEIIEQKVRDRELSLAHEISVDGKWRSLRGFLNLQAQTRSKNARRSDWDRCRMNWMRNNSHWKTHAVN